MIKNIKVISAVFIVGAVLTGCAGNRDLIAKTSSSSRQDVFKEIKPSQTASATAQLTVEFSVKSFKSRFVNIYSKHTDPPYTAVLNIDGQAVVLSDEGVMEDLPGDAGKNPEVGTGWKYNFKKSLLLQPGKHRISIAIPVSDVFVDKEIELKEGENTLTLTPVYITRLTKKPNYPVFSAGLRGIKVLLNKQDI